MTVIPNVKIPKNLYRDLTSEATWQHTTINDEIRTRIKVTLKNLNCSDEFRQHNFAESYYHNLQNKKHVFVNKTSVIFV